MIHAVYPGSFDPLHNGHVDIIHRTASIFGHLTVAVLNNPLKDTRCFSTEERLEMIRETVISMPNVSAEMFEGLLAEYMRQIEAKVIVKGLRTVADFENESQMAHLNRQLNPEVETLFIMTDTRWSYVSSTRIKELASYDADIGELVPKASLEALKRKFSRT